MCVCAALKYNRVLIQTWKEGNPVIGDNMNETGECYAK
jgi:hypothetical protein